MGYRLARLHDGIVEFHVSGPAEAPGLLVFHVGSPSAAVSYPSLTAAAARHGLRTVIYSRPGYGRSSRVAGRAVADEASRTAMLADRLGHRRFLVAGWSGGGPAALACAALLPDRVGACLTLASPAPPREVGPAWRDWYSAEDANELDSLASDERLMLIPEFEAAARLFADVTPTRLVRRMGGRGRDREVILGSDTGRSLTHSMRRGVAPGIWGWFDDNVAQALDWGFRVADIRTPVVIRQGELDRLVNPGQGRWLAAAIPGAVGRFFPDRGHSSVADPFEDVVVELVGAAGPSVP